jgi:hypothetical protein
MSTAFYRVKEHVVPCQHIRGLAHATLNSQEDLLYLAVKQYTPLDNLEPNLGDITIIGAHANGFPKVLLFLGSYILTIISNRCLGTL